MLDAIFDNVHVTANSGSNSTTVKITTEGVQITTELESVVYIYLTTPIQLPIYQARFDFGRKFFG